MTDHDASASPSATCPNCSNSFMPVDVVACPACGRLISEAFWSSHNANSAAGARNSPKVESALPAAELDALFAKARQPSTAEGSTPGRSPQQMPAFPLAEQAIYYAKTGPILGIVGAVILLVWASYFSSLTRGRPIGEWSFEAYCFVLGPGIVGAWILITRLLRLGDRDPKIVIKEEGIVLSHCDSGATIPWNHILSAQVSRNLTNYHETSAYLTLKFLSGVRVRRTQMRIDGLTESSYYIMDVIKARANLSDVKS